MLRSPGEAAELYAGMNVRINMQKIQRRHPFNCHWRNKVHAGPSANFLTGVETSVKCFFFFSPRCANHIPDGRRHNTSPQHLRVCILGL